MDVMITAILDEIVELNARLKKTIQAADSAALDWRPGTETSSVTVLATHALGATEFLVSTAAGIKVPRDREAEFRAAGVDKATLLARADEVEARVRQWLAALDPAVLSEKRWARNREQSGGLLLAHAAAHLAEHIGHAELSIQMWAQSHAKA